jgi:transposase
MSFEVPPTRRSSRRLGAFLGAGAASRSEVVVLDNLGAHKGERVQDFVETRGASLLFLPAYSPDSPPIEEAFSKIKAPLKKKAARTWEVLVEAIGKALDAVMPEDAKRWFVHCGYEAEA